jgi:choline dehydrogenase-like flavoprotein
LILDSISVDFNALEPPDVLIVGSGPVGLTLAAALETRGLTVIILEAGSKLADAHVSDDLDARCIGGNLSGITMGRTRQVGGGLNLWGGQLALFDTEDVSRPDKCKLMSWPIGWPALYDCLDETLRLLGVPEMDFRLKHEVLKHERERTHLYDLDIVQTGWLKYPKLTPKFWTRLNKSSSVSLIYNLICTTVIFDRDSARVSGVKALIPSGASINLSGKEVVLTAGCIENARLLLLRTADGQVPPWHKRNWLGGGFSEHIDATTGVIEIVDKKRISDVFDSTVHRGIKYSPKVTWSNRHRSTHPVSVCGILFWPRNFRHSLSELAHLGRALIVQRRAETLYALPEVIYASSKQALPLLYRYAKQRRIGAFIDRNAYLRVSTEQPARLESKITLAPTECDRFGIPRAVVNWVRGREELFGLRDFTYAIKNWLEGERIGKLSVDPRLEECDIEFLKAADEGLHHSGTTRMSTSSENGVVDDDLRVHGVKGLSVCGASVFPSSGYANPTLTAMVLAVRLSNRLANELRVG